ncbi:MAG: type 4a pilus biogenesis protein PilO [Candidatus Omnitrophica bacterium]|nr:type 4a pilus biogenesis protein PilO [Candidatus Omnitrophota bacterium]MDD5080963.1 type 4a pilus biogenesis protein PilO [Candidatus Omnitrophota bacterium]MDD5440606.1 type 4a pilus biogenesis protein PilO [Candidatus Omnitrophota bacterium]
MAVDLLSEKKGMDFSGSQLVAFIFFIIFIMAAISWVLLLSPKIKEIESTKKSITSFAQYDDNAFNKLANEKKDHEVETERIQSELLKIKENLIANSVGVDGVLDMLTNLAKQSNIDFTYIKPLDKKEKIIERDGIIIKLNEIPVEIELLSTFSDFLSFLWTIEHNTKMFEVSKIDIDTQKKEKSNNYKEKITVIIYQNAK